jgi:hypothetical protein
MAFRVDTVRRIKSSVMWCCVVEHFSTFRRVARVDYFIPKMKATRSFEMSWTIHPKTQHHIPGDLDLQQRLCENLKSRKETSFFLIIYDLLTKVYMLWNWLSVMLCNFYLLYDIFRHGCTYLSSCITQGTSTAVGASLTIIPTWQF